MMPHPRQLAPDELYSAGYRDGLEGRKMSPSISASREYVQGWSEGYKDYRRANPTLTVWRCWPSSKLPQALQDLDTWEHDQIKHGIGITALAFNPLKQVWVVFVSPDLIKIELPF